MIKNSLQIGSKNIANRVAMPPMVIYEFNNNKGLVSNETINHYSHYAKQKLGLIVVEATCVSAEGRLSERQLGLWNDEQIDGHKKLASAIKKEGVVALIQIHHAALRGVVKRFAPSDFELTDEYEKILLPRDEVILGSKSLEEVKASFRAKFEAEVLTTEKLDSIKQEFIDACYRAYQAGYDGVELHGAHGYLISELLNSTLNTRTDQYGGSAKNRASFACDIIKSTKEKCGSDFIVTIRMGGNDSDAVEYAKLFEEAGASALNVSYGFFTNTPEIPQEYAGEAIQYCAKIIKENVGIPVISVFKVIDSKQVNYLLESGSSDIVAVGRSALADDFWYQKLLEGKDAGRCFHCKGCMWHAANKENCPGVKLRNRNALV